jgi:hypothetical protein
MAIGERLRMEMALCRRTTWYLCLGIGILLHPTSTVQAAGQAQADSIVLQKRTLSARLDSIELEKQSRRRLGNDLGDLEAESRRVKDSIDLLRQEIAAIPKTALSSLRRQSPQTHRLAAASLDWLVPKNLFDWVIVFVGGIAVISGLFLLIGLVRSLIRKPKPPRRTPSSQTSQASSPPFRQPPPRMQPPRDASVIANDADIENDAIDSLRKRIGADSGPKLRIKHPLDTPRRAEGPNRPADGGAGKDGGLRQAILQASLAGDDAHEIARKFQVSLDQVKLILRVGSGK